MALAGLFPKTFLANNREEITWQTAYFEYWKHHVVENIFDYKIEDVIYLCENQKDEIGAILQRHGRTDAVLQTHPDYHSAQLVEEMIVFAEKNLLNTKHDPVQLYVWCHENNQVQEKILGERGYKADMSGDMVAYQRSLLKKYL